MNELRLGRICWFDIGSWPPAFDPRRRQLVRIIQLGVDATSWMYMPVAPRYDLDHRITLKCSGASDIADEAYFRPLTRAELIEVFA